MRTEFVVPVVGGIASLALTGAVRRYAVARALLDVPNARSSHSAPTPRGGGLAIAAVVLVVILGLAVARALPWNVAAAIAGGGALVAYVGWRDDRRHVPAAVRAAVHVVAAVWAVGWLGGLPALTLGSAHLAPGLAGSALAVVAIVWCVNLYNFMDGIDGIAGLEAVTVAGTLGALLLRAGQPGLGTLALAIAAAAAGFLYWNWSPARIFMGDVGSGFLGYVLAVLALAIENTAPLPGVALATLLLATFVLDATLTLLRRIQRGERWAEAHRRHAYQRAVQSGRSHAAVARAVLGLNVALGALAWFAGPDYRALPLGLAAGYALVLAAYLAVERGRPMYERGAAAPDGASGADAPHGRPP